MHIGYVNGEDGVTKRLLQMTATLLRAGTRAAFAENTWLLLQFSELKFSSRVVVITPINARHKAGRRTYTYTPTCFIDHAQHMLATGAIYRQLTPVFKGQRTTQFKIDNSLPTTSTPAVYTPTICIQ